MIIRVPHVALAGLLLATLWCSQPSAQSVPRVNGRLLRLRTDTMRITRIESGREILGGWAISTLQATSSDDLVLRYTYEVPGNATLVTVTSLNRESLQPIEEIHDYGTGDTIIVHYGSRGAHAERRGGRSTGWYDPDTAAHGAFSSAAVDLVFRTLPLGTGYRVEVPVYLAALNRTERIPVRVLDSQKVHTRGGDVVECWRLEAVFPGAAAEQFWIAKESRDLIRVLGHLSPDTLERYER